MPGVNPYVPVMLGDVLARVDAVSQRWDEMESEHAEIGATEMEARERGAATHGDGETTDG